MAPRSCRPVCLVVDDFLDDPDAVRRVALEQRFVKMHAAGLRTVESFLHLAPYKQAFERLLGCALTNFDDNAANGRFQLCSAADAIPYHSDSQSYAGVLFLTPNAPLDTGISFFRSRRSGMRGRCRDPELMAQTFGRGAEFDRSCWEEVDRIANLYNRLVLFDAHLAHGATAYFGMGLAGGRLFQNFFFDVAADETTAGQRNDESSLATRSVASTSEPDTARASPSAAASTRAFDEPARAKRRAASSRRRT